MKFLHLAIILALFAVGTATAEQSALEGAATQVLKDKAMEAAPQDAVEGAKAASDAVEKAKTLKESMGTSLQEQAADQLKQKASGAVPVDAQKGATTLQSGAKTATKAKATMSAPGKAANEVTDAAKKKATQKGTEKALDLVP